MEIPVVIRPTATGFRASTGGPWDVTEDGPSRNAAVAAVRARVAAEVSAGATVENVRVTDEQPTERATLEELRQRIAEKLTADRIVNGPAKAPGASFGATREGFLAAWDRLANNPLLDEFDRAVAEARRQMEAEEEARERAAEGQPTAPIQAD